MDFEVVLKALGQLQLTPDEVAALRTFLATVTHPGECLAVIEAAAGRPPCPHCACSRCHRRHGQRPATLSLHGLRSSFNALTGTPGRLQAAMNYWM